MHEHYTPKSTEFQAFLDKIPIFVDYANIYVNAIMLTKNTATESAFIIFDDNAIYRVVPRLAVLNIDFASFLAIRM